MSTASIVGTPDEAAELEAVLTRTIAQISEIREQMRTDDVEIARIKAENAVLKAETAALKAETRALHEETLRIIAGLRSTA